MIDSSATRNRTRRRLFAAAVGCAAIAMAAGAAVTGAQEIVATGVVRGRVVAAANGAPIQYAEVRLRRVDGRDNRLLRTNQQGAFEFTGLAEGDWTLTASKPGFVTQQFGQEHPLKEAPALALRTGQRLVADIRLSRGGAIAGRVLDQFGEPVAAAQVQVLRTRLEHGERRLVAVGMSDATDDTGAFRIYNLIPGDYYVAATLRDASSSLTRANEAVATYYPGTTRIREAQRIRVDQGQDAPAITIVSAPPVAGTTVAGLVLDASGGPAGGAMIHLYDGDALAAVATKGAFVQADARGRFSIDDVVPGSYVVDLTTRSAPGVIGFERAVVPIDVPAGGVADLTLATARASTLQLTVVAAPGLKLPAPLTIGFSARTGGNLNFVNNRMTFAGDSVGRALQIPALFGRTVLSLTDLPEGWVLDALEIGGRDVADTEVDFSTLGATVAARAVLSNRPAAVSGVVTVRGQPTPATVVVFVEDSARWTYPSRFVRTARAGDDGRFVIDGLPPADRYRAVAVSFLDEEEIQDPDTLEAMKAAGVGFRLLRGEQKTLDVQAIVR